MNIKLKKICVVPIVGATIGLMAAVATNNSLVFGMVAGAAFVSVIMLCVALMEWGFD